MNTGRLEIASEEYLRKIPRNDIYIHCKILIKIKIEVKYVGFLSYEVLGFPELV